MKKFDLNLDTSEEGTKKTPSKMKPMGLGLNLDFVNKDVD
jgi:hypothetical protein